MIRYARFTFHGQEFGAMDSGHDHGFAFNEAVSFIVPWDTQEEIDGYWAKLCADPKAEQCGWLNDIYGLSWRITPTIMNQMTESDDPQKAARVTHAFLRTKKFDISTLKKGL